MPLYFASGTISLYHDDFSLYHDDFPSFSGLPEESVDLIVTSPPYDVDIQYDGYTDNLPYPKYLVGSITLPLSGTSKTYLGGQRGALG